MGDGRGGFLRVVSRKNWPRVEERGRSGGGCGGYTGREWESGRVWSGVRRGLGAREPAAVGEEIRTAVMGRRVRVCSSLSLVLGLRFGQ